MTFEHASGHPKTYDRTSAKPTFSDVIWPEDAYIQGADLNEAFSRNRARDRRVGNLIAREGNRISGAEIKIEAGVITLTQGQIYLEGDVRSVGTATLTGVPMTGDVLVGVRIVTSVVTHVDDPDLMGLEPGTEADGEPGAIRTRETVTWSWEGDSLPGTFYAVYTLNNGVPLDQTPPPILEGVSQAIAVYDYDAHRNYVVSGCEVSALGSVGGAQRFSIGRGVANILGFKRTREYDLLHDEPEVADTEEIEAEPHTYGSGASSVIPTNYSPVSAVLAVTVEKQETVTLTRGAAGGADALPRTSSTTIVSVTANAGATVYAVTTSWVKTGDTVNWSPAGVEPAVASTYQVTYKYLDVVSAGPGGYEVEAAGIRVYGGATGGQVIFRYSWKMPRIDIICLDDDGASVYIKGIAARQNPLPPVTPTEILKLAEIHNTFTATPEVRNIATRARSFDELAREASINIDTRDIVSLLRLIVSANQREAVAKLAMFNDPFENDFYRDGGINQTAACVDGFLQLPITVSATGVQSFNNPAVMLDWTPEIVVQQKLSSACQKINPFQSFDFNNGVMTINPESDFWTDFKTVFTSPVTQVFTSPNGIVPATSTTRTEVADVDRDKLPYLRRISIAFNIRGFAVNEQLTSLKFAGVDVTPAPVLAASATGVITGSFVVPDNIKAGSKRVSAVGSAGTKATALFVGQGEVEIETRRNVSTIIFASERSRDTDPLAQTFTLREGRFIAAVDLKFCAKGNASVPVFVDIVRTSNGFPTRESIATAVVDMGPVVLGQWRRCTLRAPVWLARNVEYAIVVRTNDANHSIRIAIRNQADIDTGQKIAGQPYTIGVLLMSSNNRTWTANQDADMTFRLVGCKFAPTTKTFEFGSVGLVDCSDLLLKAAVELPTAAAKAVFEIVRQSGQVIQMQANQWQQFATYLNEPVTVRVQLTGSATVSPVIYPSVSTVQGKIAATAEYITRQWNTGTNPARLLNRIKALLPPGSTLTYSVWITNAWVDLTAPTTETLLDGFTEYRWERNPFTAATAKIKIALTGSPAARPKLSDLRSFTA